MAIWLCAAGRVRVPAAEAFLLAPPLFLLAYLSFAFDTQIGLRYLMPAFPFAFVFTARVAVWRLGGSPSLRTAPAVLVGRLAAWTAAASLAVHPYYLPYFNELIGGPRDGYTELVADPSYAWLREHFRPAEIVHNSWAVYDVSGDEIERCCSAMEQAWSLPDPEGNLATAGEAIGSGEGAGLLHLDRLNDGMLGANTEADAAQTGPSPSPVRAWFGIAWKRPHQAMLQMDKIDIERLQQAYEQ